MAIRIRKVDGDIVAVCAAHSKAKAGDHYIDDAEDHALRVKFLIDYESEGLIIENPVFDDERARIKQEETEHCGRNCPECPPPTTHTNDG